MKLEPREREQAGLLPRLSKDSGEAEAIEVVEVGGESTLGDGPREVGNAGEPVPGDMELGSGDPVGLLKSSVFTERPAVKTGRFGPAFGCQFLIICAPLAAAVSSLGIACAGMGVLLTVG